MNYTRQDLDLAQQRVDESNAKVSDQRKRVAALFTNGHDTSAARRLLLQAERAQTDFVKHRNTIAAQIARTT